MKNLSTQRIFIHHSDWDHLADREDTVIVEAPLQIATVNDAGIARPHNITMRTPGNDVELAIGFFYNENIINHTGDLISVRHQEDTVYLKIQLSTTQPINVKERNLYMTSSCGICGKENTDDLYDGLQILPAPVLFDFNRLTDMYAYMAQHQTLFNATGACHGAGIFETGGRPVVLREDVGRHNAVDKCAGYLFQNNLLRQIPFVLCLSGRSCFELIQKAIRMGCSVVTSIGAPTSAAIELASKYQVTLIGFFKDKGFNLYTNFTK